MLYMARDLFKLSLYLFRGALLPGLSEEEDYSPTTGPQMIPQNMQAIVGVTMTLSRLAYTHDLEDKTSIVYIYLKTDIVETV